MGHKADRRTVRITGSGGLGDPGLAPRVFGEAAKTAASSQGHSGDSRGSPGASTAGLRRSRQDGSEQPKAPRPPVSTLSRTTAKATEGRRAGKPVRVAQSPGAVRPRACPAAELPDFRAHVSEVDGCGDKGG